MLQIAVLVLFPLLVNDTCHISINIWLKITSIPLQCGPLCFDRASEEGSTHSSLWSYHHLTSSLWSFHYCVDLFSLQRSGWDAINQIWLWLTWENPDDSRTHAMLWKSGKQESVTVRSQKSCPLSRLFPRDLRLDVTQVSHFAEQQRCVFSTCRSNCVLEVCHKLPLNPSLRHGWQTLTNAEKMCFWHSSWASKVFETSAQAAGGK